MSGWFFYVRLAVKDSLHNVSVPFLCLADGTPSAQDADALAKALRLPASLRALRDFQ